MDPPPPVPRKRMENWSNFEGSNWASFVGLLELVMGGGLVKWAME